MQKKLTKLNLLRSLFVWSFALLSVQAADLKELLERAEAKNPFDSYCKS